MASESPTVLRPNLVAALPSTLFLLSIVVGFGGVFVAIVGGVLVAGLVGMWVFGPFILGTLLLTVLSVVVLSVLLNVRTEYRIYEDRIERERGYVRPDEKTVYVENVIDVEYNRSILDRLVGTGSIRLSLSGGSHGELQIRNVPHSKELIDQVRAKMD